LEPKIRDYKNLLAKAGREVADNMKLSAETTAELEKPILPREMHLDISKKRWDEAINRGKKVWALKE
jgi:hypothetical protein